VGIAFAAARVAVLLGEHALLSSARHLVERALAEGEDEQDFDLLGGKAGTIVAMLALRELLPEPCSTESALSLGDALLHSAQRSDEGYSWRSASAPTARNLTGFSHGTAGAGYALLELFRATNDARFRDGADGAFRYERHWFDADAGNWPDFREQPARRNRGRHAGVCSTYWCHGAPGIALSRLRAYAALRDSVCAMEARTALRTTRATVETELDSGLGSHSLCHGLSGNIEALLYGEEILGTECSEAAALAHRVADAGIERYAAVSAWPCGAGGGETPGLMLGLAGSGTRI
jgi:lantibiotic modifying enzyme